MVTIDEFFAFRLAQRNDEKGGWEYSCLRHVRPGRSLSTPNGPNGDVHLELESSYPPANHFIRTLVKVDAHIPFLIEGINKSATKGAGVVVDPTLGWVVCDRSAVPTSLCEIILTFTNNVTVDSRVLFMHRKSWEYSSGHIFDIFSVSKLCLTWL